MNPVAALIHVCRRRREMRRCKHQNATYDWYDIAPMMHKTESIYLAIQKCPDCGGVFIV